MPSVAVTLKFPASPFPNVEADKLAPSIMRKPWVWMVTSPPFPVALELTLANKPLGLLPLGLPINSISVALTFNSPASPVPKVDTDI